MISLEDAYRMMVRIRAVESELLKLSSAGALRGSLHLCQGQEAIPAGTCAALEDRDFLTATYRGHGYAIAKGVNLRAIIAEILGKATGLCKGKGGKMHLFDLSLGLLGTNGIVGAAVGTACGAALTAKLDRSGAVAVTVFGDGAINQGHAMECLNMAALYQLPVLFLCENNLYAEMTPLSRSHGNQNLTERASAFGIQTREVDGNDPIAVHAVVSEWVERARQGVGPLFLEAHTYRTIGHYQADPGTSYRSAEEVDEWREKSPIRLTAEKLGGRAAEIDSEENQAIAALFQSVLLDPEPSVQEAATEVFA